MFAVLAALACGVFLPPVQCNGIALSCSRSFGVDVWVIGLIVATLIGLVIIGGVKRIANVAQIVAPVMAVVYIILSIVVLAVHWQLVLMCLCKCCVVRWVSMKLVVHCWEVQLLGG